jgi:hypothetical protein
MINTCSIQLGWMTVFWRNTTPRQFGMFAIDIAPPDDAWYVMITLGSRTGRVLSYKLGRDEGQWL